MSVWFLVTIGGLMYIGPLDEQHCKLAAMALVEEGVVCMQPRGAMLCPAPDHPAAYMACPLFEFPKVQMK